jgi:hypothetical protein
MNPFWETLSVTGAIAVVIVAVIITLTLFYRGLTWISGAGAKPEALTVRGVLKKNTLATVHLVGGQTLVNIRFIGFTSTDSVKSQLPFGLNGMVILAVVGPPELEIAPGVRYG